MSKAARRYDVYLPLKYNDGRDVEIEKFNDVERLMIDRFSGMTAQQRKFPFRGVWQSSGESFVDDVIVMTSLDVRPKGSTRFITQLKRRLLDEFKQLEILITETALRIH